MSSVDAAAARISPSPPKPRMRGMLHMLAFPVSLVTGLILVVFVADTPTERWGCLVFALATAELFGVSALYHRGHWSPRTHALLRRLDHSNIFLMIAGTYTPICLALLDGTARTVVLTVVWVGALAGIVFRVAWLSAPPWLYTPFYVALGWVAVSVLPALARNGGAGTVALIIAGGLAYSVGGLVYALKRPDPAPATFGYHEIFHTCTLIGFACHYAAVVLAVS
ncbi:MAG TPA: hemolysin III family protein [Acidimicrobiales bacterium]|nr:hemolysin III family protein [Acidimicrobiales bacterium]